MINVMCMSLNISYDNPNQYGKTQVTSSHYLGLSKEVFTDKKTINSIAMALVQDARKTLEGVDDKTMLIFGIVSFAFVTKVDNFHEFANTKRALMVDDLCIPYVHANGVDLDG